MATKKTTKKPAAPKPKPAKREWTDEQILEITNVTATGFGLGPANVIAVNKTSRRPLPGAVPRAVAEQMDDFILIPCRPFTEAQYSQAEVRAFVESES